MSGDIFKLLLLMLLIISDRESNCSNSLFSTLNTLMIVSLLLKSDDMSGAPTPPVPPAPIPGIFPAP